MSDTDPLLRAVAQGDPAAPDGRALAALGQLVRDAASLPGHQDLTDRVLTRIQTGEEDTRDIDAWVEQGDCDDRALAQLLRLTRLAAKPPRPVDLTGQVRLRLGAGRFIAAFDDRSGTVRRRVRIVAMVIAGHLAAALMFGLVQVNLGAGLAESGAGGLGNDLTSLSDDKHKAPGRQDQGATLLPSRLPQAWTLIREIDGDLLLLRKLPELRAEARHQAGLDSTAQVVSEGLAWLVSRQQPEGNGSIGTLSGNRDHDLATQALAALALLGEGCGDKKRSVAIRNVLAWIANDLARTDTATPPLYPCGLASLALVEGALLFNEGALKDQAEWALTLLAAQPLQPGTDGQGGFALLALETAQQASLRAPGSLLQQARHNIARALPPETASTGRRGLAAFSRFMFGHRSLSSTAQLVDGLARDNPGRTENVPVDAASWFFASLALRETGGAPWATWAKALNDTLTPLFFSSEPGKRFVPAQRIVGNDLAGDPAVFSTAVVLLNLQTPYRYLPMAGAAAP